MNPQTLLPPAIARQLRTARQLSEDLRRTEEERQLGTACPALDRLLAGGIRRGSMIELIGRRSSGRFSLVNTTLAAVTGRGEAAALVDLGDGFDPRLATAAGVDLERLLWARPRHLKEVLASTETILRCGVPLVVVEMGMPPIPGGRGAEASWLRLARAARAHRTALLVASPYRVSGTAAQAVLEIRATRPRWRGRGATPRLLGGIATELELVKSRAVPDVPRSASPRTGDHETLSLHTSANLMPDRQLGAGTVVRWPSPPRPSLAEPTEECRAIA